MFKSCNPFHDGTIYFLLEADVRMASAVERTDDLVREYLIYRGFTSTLKHLDTDIKADKEKGFRVSISKELSNECFSFFFLFIVMDLNKITLYVFCTQR